MTTTPGGALRYNDAVMALSTGTRLGPYEILAPLGAGGMGEVYRARDPRIGREVAIKVLPASYATDADRLRRFEIEARATGVLNHPNILSIFDVGTGSDAPYLVSELLEGETLREKLRNGAMPQRKAIDCALQTASGLSAAHEKGIAHRDLKPENIFLTKDGRVKILDFGLAKLVLPEAGKEEASKLETGVVESQPGMVLGTVGYMSPEQVRGRPSDHRSDIFAFGAILYEMLTAKRAFQGQTPADTMSAILQKDPPELTLSDTSPGLQRLIGRCLEKDPAQRFHSAHDLAFALESLSANTGSMPATAKAVQRNGRSIARWAHLAFTIVLAAAALFFALQYFQPKQQTQNMVQALIAPPENGSFQPFSELGMALSPDGKIQAFVALIDGRKQLWIRRLNETTATHLAGTDGATYPFWSPDSRWIGFFADGKLKKIETTGSPPETLCDAPLGRGGTWNDRGTILFAPTINNLIHQVAANGGEPKPVLKPTGKPEGEDQRWPAFLPDGNHFLFSRNISRELWIAQLDPPDSHVLLPGCSNAMYVSPGYLIFSRNGALMAQAFDVKTNRLQGEAFPILKEKVIFYGPKTYAGFAASSSGILSYLADETSPTQLTWVNRAGQTLSTLGKKGFYQSPRLSPDGKRIVLIRVDPDSTSFRDIWTYELDRQNLSRFTFGPREYWSPLWSSDGRFIFFGSNIAGTGNIFRQSTEGSATETAIVRDSHFKRPTDVSNDGKFLSFYSIGSDTGNDIWILPLTQDAKPFPYLQTPFGEWDAQFSPDAKWIAYTSDESGKREVYVQSFPPGNGKWQISTGGGQYPKWPHSGNEIFFSTLDDVLTAVSVKTSPAFSIGKATPLFKLPHGAPYAESDDILAYDVSPDGQRFLLNVPTETAKPSYITLVLNWTAALARH